MKKDAGAEVCARRLRALADPDRLRIVRALAERAQHVSDLAFLLELQIQNASHHLKVLRREGIVEGRKSGRFVTYRLAVGVFGQQPRCAAQVDLGCCQVRWQ